MEEEPVCFDCFLANVDVSTTNAKKLPFWLYLAAFADFTQ